MTEFPELTGDSVPIIGDAVSSTGDGVSEAGNGVLTAGAGVRNDGDGVLTTGPDVSGSKGDGVTARGDGVLAMGDGVFTGDRGLVCSHVASHASSISPTSRLSFLYIGRKAPLVKEISSATDCTHAIHSWISMFDHGCWSTSQNRMSNVRLVNVVMLWISLLLLNDLEACI